METEKKGGWALQELYHIGVGECAQLKVLSPLTPSGPEVVMAVLALYLSVAQVFDRPYRPR